MFVGLGDLRVHTSTALPLTAGFPLTGLHSQVQLQKGHVLLLFIMHQVTNTIAFRQALVYHSLSSVVVADCWCNLLQAEGPHPLIYPSLIIWAPTLTKKRPSETWILLQHSQEFNS